MAKRKRDHSDIPALPFDDRAASEDGVTSSHDEHNQPHSVGSESAPPVTAAPDFDALLRKRAISAPLPSDFSVSTEAQHLSGLWQSNREFRRYLFLRFIHAGGSGMVFEVAKTNHQIGRA